MPLSYPTRRCANLLTAAIWSYGVAGAGFLAFALRMALGWRGGPRAALLLSAIIASALWAACEVTVAIWPSVATLIAANGLDALRYALWFGFLYGLVGTTRRSAVEASAKLVGAPRWLIVAVAAALIASVALSRIYLGVHYLTDVAAGVILGLAWLSLSARVRESSERHHPM